MLDVTLIVLTNIDAYRFCLTWLSETFDFFDTAYISRTYRQPCYEGCVFFSELAELDI